jgi:hypothetical protein
LNFFSRARFPVSSRQVPSPPEKCEGQLYTVRRFDTLHRVAQRFGVTVRQILAANPQITNPNALFVGQQICIPDGAPPPQPNGQLRVLTVRFFTEEGQRLPTENGAVRLAARTIVRATFTRPVSRAFFFLEPTGTETCELARLIGIDCPSATTGVAEVLWQVPRGTLGRVYVVACINSVCAKSGDVLVVRE